MDLICLNCDWRGTDDQLIETPWSPDDDLPIDGETHEVCPNCKSPAWEPVD